MSDERGRGTRLEEEFRAFFERYARTFHEDLERFCDLYEFPCETTRLDGTVLRFSTKRDAVSFFAAAKKGYEAEGCRRWNIRALSADQRPSGRALVVVEWDMIDEASAPIRGWTQSYSLVDSIGAWKVCASTLHPGSQRTYRVLPDRPSQTDAPAPVRR
jgi:hypothetical protein